MHLWKSEKNTGTVSKVTSRKPFWQTGWSSQIPSWTDLYYKDQMHGTNLSSNLALISRRALFFKPGSRKASLLMTDFSKLMSTEYLQRNKQTTNQKLKHFLDHIPQEKSSTHLVIVLLAAMKECRPKNGLNLKKYWATGCLNILWCPAAWLCLKQTNISATEKSFASRLRTRILKTTKIRYP